jgi:4-hydroxymandelate oxidase
MSPNLQALPPHLHALADHEAHARTQLDAGIWAYFHGGAADETTLQANQQAWQDILLRPRVLRPLDGLNTRMHLLQRDWPTPLLVAPMAQQQLLHRDGECATAMAAAALGAGMVLSTQSSQPLEHVAALQLRDVDRGPLWFQLYMLGDRGWLLELMQRAAQAGYEALVLTVDAPVNGVRDRERRSGFTLPPGFFPAHRPPTQSPSAPTWPQLLQQAPTWDDVRWLLEHAPLPVLLKGITHPDDATLACELGAGGLVVSNHGGRVLDTLPATAHLLPEIVNAVQNRCPLLVDGGLRRGTDVFKALALGAHAVLIGRPVAYGLANAGASGVAHVLRLLLDELMATMALCGCRSLAEIQPHHLKHTRFNI